jgi:hypothetical protein
MTGTGTVSGYCTRCGCKRANHDDAGCVLHTKCKTSDAESRYFTARKRQPKQKQAAADYELKRQEGQSYA